MEQRAVPIAAILETITLVRQSLFWGSGVFIVLLAISILSASGAIWLTRRRREQEKVAQADTDSLAGALKRLADGDYAMSAPQFLSPNLAPISDLLAATVATMRTTFERLERSARHDQLTELLNPASFKHDCKALLTREGRSGIGVLLYFDVNDFKKINDSLGHNAGDRFLRVCADRMRLAAASYKLPRIHALAAGESIDGLEAIVGRLGGDEFGIFLPGLVAREEVEKFILRLKRLIGEPFQLGAHSLRAKISVGAAFSVEHHNCFDKLVAAADTAMYEAKAHRDAGVCFYQPTMRNKADRILETELELRTALQNGQFRLFFQPQINLARNTIDCAEALIRWEHPTRGLVMPGEFIPFAEDHDLIDDIGDWVIGEAVRTAARWWEEGREIKVAINVSPKQLNRVELIPLIRASLKRYNLPPRAFEVEFTEEALMHNDEMALERIGGLRRDGVSIALDDFGTGYSNIAQLLALPMDQLKLDRSLLLASASDRRRRMVFLAIMGLANKLGFKVVAEGVETEEQMKFLRQSGCHFAQGYLLSRPLPENEFLQLVDEHDSRRAALVA